MDYDELRESLFRFIVGNIMERLLICYDFEFVINSGVFLYKFFNFCEF